jgi:hypothetical protein
MTIGAVRRSSWLTGTALLVTLGGLGGCAREGPPKAATAAAATPVRFREVAREAGIRFVQGHKRRRPLTILETVGCGGAFLDYDGDGWLDILLVGQTTRAPEPACALYRNRGDGTFADVTRAAGLDRPALWMGCAVADYDNDGDTDLLLTGYGALALYRNEPPPSSGAGSGGASPRRFVEVTREAGIRAAPRDWFTSAGWADVDGDGFLDFYAARYVRFDDRAPQFCYLGFNPQGQQVRGTCGPELYDAQHGAFYHNRGAAAGYAFEEATARFGLARTRGKGLGVAFGDFDDDGRPDLYVANDRTPGDLFHNQLPGPGSRLPASNERRTPRSGRGWPVVGRKPETGSPEPPFRNVGAESGTAYSGDSRPQAGMGVDWGDYDGDGRLDLIVTTFFLERKSLYRNEGPEGFREVSDEAGLAPAIRRVGWGVRFFDADNDGRLDLVIANGHAVDGLGEVDPEQPYEQPTLLFHREGAGFQEIGVRACPALARPIAGRGVATGDYNNDGRLDLLVTNAEGEPLLLRNESAAGRHWLQVRLVGGVGTQGGDREARRRSNRQGIGARVWVAADGVTQMREVTTGGGYLSASDPRLYFGLGSATRVGRLRVRWPSGATQELTDLPVDREVTLEEPQGP